jgi:hypothetical protein
MQMPDADAAQQQEQKAFERARALTVLGRDAAAQQLWQRLLESSTQQRVIKEGLRFFAEDASPRHAQWALWRLDQTGMHDEAFDALRLLLAQRAQSAARVEPLLPRISAWIARLPRD